MKFGPVTSGLALTICLLSSCSAENRSVAPSETIQPQLYDYPKSIHFRNRLCQIVVPKEYAFDQSTEQTKSTVLFAGPKYDGNKSPVVSLNIVEPPSGEKLVSEQVMLAAMLNPFRKTLAKYDEASLEPLTIDGKIFKGSSFSGEYPDLSQTRGFVYVTLDKGTYFIFFGQDRNSNFGKSEPVMMKLTKSFKILS